MPMAVAMSEMQRLGSVIGPGASGEWRANRDFALKNLSCKKGELLPPKWQHHELVQYLQKTYGPDCVVQGNEKGRRFRKLKPTGKPGKAE